jgi:ribosome-associated toxin RatA of RatAB toxin-antitoxin module
MYHISKDLFVFHTAQAMFDLVANIEQYPHFLPWCAHAKVLSREADGCTLTGELGIRYWGIEQAFSTHNRHESPHTIYFELASGPFQHLSGEWHFTAMDDTACKIEFRQSYAFSNAWLEKIIAPMFTHISNTLIDLFIQEADRRAKLDHKDML